MIKNLEDHKRDEEKEKQELLQISEVSLWLYGYDDLFSDFDPRPYAQRALSEDFLEESKRITKQKESGRLQLTFSVPEKSRDAEKEKIIKKRLRDHFKKRHEMIKGELGNRTKFGMGFVISGLTLMFTAAYLLFKFHQSTLWTSLLIVLFEPGGWFLFWEGLDVLIFELKDVRPEVEFYDKMARAEIDFISYRAIDIFLNDFY